SESPGAAAPGAMRSALFGGARHVAVPHVLRLSVFGLETHVGVVRRLLRLGGAPAKFGGITEVQHLPRKLGERTIDLVLRTLHGEQVDQVERRAIELLEHLVAAAPLGEEAFADLPEDLDAVACTDLGAAQRL